MYFKQLQEIKEQYLYELEYFDQLETTSAPSGEWEEYNVHYLIQQNRVEVYEKVLNTLGEQDFIDEQYEQEEE